MAAALAAGGIRRRLEMFLLAHAKLHNREPCLDMQDMMKLVEILEESKWRKIKVKQVCRQAFEGEPLPLRATLVAIPLDRIFGRACVAALNLDALHTKLAGTLARSWPSPPGPIPILDLEATADAIVLSSGDEVGQEPGGRELVAIEGARRQKRKLTQNREDRTAEQLVLYAEMPADALILTAARNYRRAEENAAKARKAEQRARRWEERAHELENRLVLAQQKKHDEELLHIKHAANKMLKGTTIIAVGLRRNMSNTAASDLGPLVLTDISKQSVLKAEVLTGAALMGYAQDWHKANEMGLKRVRVGRIDAEALVVAHPDPPEKDPEFQVAFHYIAGDATNSRVWRGSKVHTCEVWSGYLHDPAVLRDGQSVHDVMVCERFLSDIQVQEDASAHGTYAMIQKQVISAGCPLWTTQWMQPGGSTTQVFELLLHCSDRGSDQSKVRRILRHELMDKPLTLYLDWDCTLHATQLVFGHSIDILDAWCTRAGKPYKYFNAIAKLINCWREHCGAIYEMWARMSVQGANKFAMRQPPRCLAGRWGSIFATEELLVQVQKYIQQIFPDVLAKRARDAPQPGVAADADLRTEAQVEYRARYGRWSKETIETIADNFFWLMLRRSHRHHTIPNDLMQYAHKHNLTKVATRKGKVQFGLVYHLATGLAETYHGKFDELLQKHEAWRPLLADVPGEYAGPFVELIVLLGLQQASYFRRQIYMPATRLSGFENNPDQGRPRTKDQRFALTNPSPIAQIGEAAITY